MGFVIQGYLFKTGPKRLTAGLLFSHNQTHHRPQSNSTPSHILQIFSKLSLSNKICSKVLIDKYFDLAQ